MTTARQYPESEGLEVATHGNPRNSHHLDGLQLSPQEKEPSLEVTGSPRSPPLEVDKRGIWRNEPTSLGEKEVRPGEGKLLAHPRLEDKEVAGSSGDGDALGTSGKKSIWRRHPRRFIFGAVLAIVVIIVAIVVPIVVTKSNSNNQSSTPVGASSPSPGTTTVIVTTSAPTSSSSQSATTTNPPSSSNTAPASSAQPSASTSSSTAGDSSAFQAFTDLSCGNSGSAGGTNNFNGLCQKAPASGALRVARVKDGCQMTVYSDPFCSFDRTVAPVGVCATANGKNVASYSIDCSSA